MTRTLGNTAGVLFSINTGTSLPQLSRFKTQMIMQKYFHHLFTWKDGHVWVGKTPFSDSLLCLLCLAFRHFFSARRYKVVANFVFCCTTTGGRGNGKQMCRFARRQIYSELQHHGTSTMTLFSSSSIPCFRHEADRPDIA